MKETRKEKPGFMIYHRQLNAMKNLDPERFKRLILAFGDYSEGGELPAEMDGADLAIFEMYRERLDHDQERYEARAEAGRKGGRKSSTARKQKGEPKQSEAESSKPKQTQANEPTTSTSTTTPTPTPTTTPTSTPTSTPTPTPTTTPTAASSSSLPDDHPTELTAASLKKEEEAFPPEKGMILSYLREKGWTDVDADDFLARCREAGWKDGNGQPVKNWRLWLKGYIMKQSAEASRNRCAPDPRIAALEKLKQKYITEEGAEDE